MQMPLVQTTCATGGCFCVFVVRRCRLLAGVDHRVRVLLLSRSVVSSNAGASVVAAVCCGGCPLCRWCSSPLSLPHCQLLVRVAWLSKLLRLCRGCCCHGSVRGHCRCRWCFRHAILSSGWCDVWCCGSAVGNDHRYRRCGWYVLPFRRMHHDHGYCRSHCVA